MSHVLPSGAKGLVLLSITGYPTEERHIERHICRDGSIYRKYRDIIIIIIWKNEVHKKKEGRKKLNYDVQTYSISATISNGQKSDGSRSTSETSSHGSEPR